MKLYIKFSKDYKGNYFDCRLIEQSDNDPAPSESYCCRPKEKGLLDQGNELEKWLNEHDAHFRDDQIRYTPSMSLQLKYEYLSRYYGLKFEDFKGDPFLDEPCSNLDDEFDVERLREYWIKKGRKWSNKIKMEFLEARKAGCENCERVYYLIERAMYEVKRANRLAEVYALTGVRFVEGDERTFLEHYEKWVNAKERGLCEDSFAAYMQRSDWDGRYTLDESNHSEYNAESADTEEMEERNEEADEPPKHDILDAMERHATIKGVNERIRTVADELGVKAGRVRGVWYRHQNDLKNKE